MRGLLEHRGWFPDVPVAGIDEMRRDHERLVEQHEAADSPRARASVLLSLVRFAERAEDRLIEPLERLQAALSARLADGSRASSRDEEVLRFARSVIDGRHLAGQVAELRREAAELLMSDGHGRVSMSAPETALGRA